MTKWKELALELVTIGKEVSRQITQLKEETAALKRENERLRKTIEDVLTRKVSSSVRAILRIALLADTKGPS